jgi:DNA-binding CsgD family transcriptional regulator
MPVRLGPRGLLFCMSDATLNPAINSASLLATLTPREREIMHWVSQGKSNWEVVQILGCVEQTVKKHLQRIYRKLGVENRMAAANCLRE